MDPDSVVILDRYIESLSAGDPHLTARVAAAAAAAKGFGAMALGIVARRSKLLSHEMGHVYLGGSPHCKPSAWRDCFEEASQFWLCRVNAKLGLPHDAYVGANVNSPRSYTGTTVDDWYDDKHLSMENAYYLVPGSCEADGGNDTSEEGLPDPGHSKCRSAFYCKIHDPGEVNSNYTFCATNGCNCTYNMSTIQCIEFWLTYGGAGCMVSNR